MPANPLNMRGRRCLVATILDFGAWRAQDVLPGFWVDNSATTETADAPRGWLRNVAAIAEVMFADEIGAPDRGRVDWLCAQTKDFVDSVGGKTALIFRLSVTATSWLSPLFVGKLPPITRLSFRDRVSALNRYEASPLGLSVFAVKAFLSMHWFEHPEVAREVGFDGQPMGRPD